MRQTQARGVVHLVWHRPAAAQPPAHDSCTQQKLLLGVHPHTRTHTHSKPLILYTPHAHSHTCPLPECCERSVYVHTHTHATWPPSSRCTQTPCHPPKSPPPPTEPNSPRTRGGSSEEAEGMMFPSFAAAAATESSHTHTHTHTHMIGSHESQRQRRRLWLRPKLQGRCPAHPSTPIICITQKLCGPSPLIRAQHTRTPHIIITRWARVIAHVAANLPWCKTPHTYTELPQHCRNAAPLQLTSNVCLHRVKNPSAPKHKHTPATTDCLPCC